MSSEIQKNESRLRWVEVDVNPTVHFIVSIFVFMLMLSEIQKSRSGLRWVEVNPKPTSVRAQFNKRLKETLRARISSVIFQFFLAKTRKLAWH